MEMQGAWTVAARLLAVFIFGARATLHYETSSPSAMLAKVSRDYWAWRMDEFPQLATYRGVHEYDHRLDEYTKEAFRRRRDRCQQFLSIVQKIPMDQLTEKERENHEVLSVELDQFVQGYKFVNFGNLNPVNFLEGIHRSPGWVSRMLYRNEDDYRKLESRLRGLSKQIYDVISLMEEAIRLRRTYHRVSVQSVPEQIAAIIRPSNYSMFYYPYREEIMRNSSVPRARWPFLQRRALQIITSEINPAFFKLIDFMRDRYMNNTRPSYGVGALEFGQEYYQACLRFHLSSNVTASQVHQIGLREVARIRAQMERVMARYGFRGRISEFVDYLKINRTKELYNRTDRQLLQGYHHIVQNRINPKLNLVVRNIPDVPLHIRPMPYDGPAGSYGSNTFWVNVFRPHNRPVYTMMALTLHEANPGHHLQTVVARQQPLPAFRRYSTSSRYYAAPFNFPWYTAYTEGWALYCEYLGEEMGLYNESVLELFGRYSSEIFRAGRLVVDTGIHAFGNSRQWAIDFLANYTAQPLGQIRTEVDRYITWPGQACAYKMGELEIKRIRSNAAKQLGEKFDVRDFNEIVLKLGRSPLSVVEKSVNAYVKRLLNGGSAPSAANCCYFWFFLALLVIEML